MRARLACVQGDQASIVGGAINFVKELEQLLQSLEAQKRRQRCTEPPPPAPFAGFFIFPQYSTTAATCGAVGSSSDSAGSGGDQSGGGGGAGARRGVADIEVSLAESHANVKVLAARRPRQLLRMVVALQCLGLTVLHLNVTTTADQLVLYSLSLKVLLLALAACRRSRPRFPRALHCIALSETTLAAIASGLDLPCRVVFNEADSARPGVSVLH